MSARDLVTTIRGDDQHRLCLQRCGERRKKLERRRVRPVEIIEEDAGRSPPANRRESTADRLEQGSTVGGPRRGAELGQEQCEIRPEWPAVSKTVRDETKVRAEDGDDLPVGRRPLLSRCRAHEREIASPEDMLDKARFADSGFTPHEQQPAAPVGGGLERAPELLALRLAPNQLLELDSPGQTTRLLRKGPQAA